MAITVTLYTFAKRENSTKQPTGGGTDYSCIMMDDTSLMDPTFKLSIASNPIGKNYAYVSDFNRYYFITDISTSQGFWYISCKCDVLASFKSTIGTETHYVLRAASAFDGYITDNTYPAKQKESSGKNNQVSSDPLAWSLGHSYILGIVASNPPDVSSCQAGSVVYYHMDETVLNTYMNWLMTNIETWSGITEYSPGVTKALVNPIQYIVSCQAVPVAPPASLVVNEINFGGYVSVTIDAGQMDVLQIIDPDSPQRTHGAFIKHESFSVTLPKHPQATSRGKYLNGDPYSNYVLHFGPFGDIPLDPGALIDCTTVSGHMEIDLITGIGRLIVYGTENANAILYNGTAKISADINLSQITNNAYSSRNKYWSEMMNTMSAVAGTNPLAGAMKAIEGGMTMTETAASYRFPNVSGQGSTGSFLSFFDDENIYVTAKFIELVDENLTELGRPLCQPKQINTLSGYILCQNADAQINGTADEASLINSYMNSGFFYE